MKKQIHSLSSLKQLRKDFRNNGTSAEAVLWRYLKNSQLEEKKFRRQHSIRKYIVDFYCPSEDIVIELDGQHHYEVGGQIYDAFRDKELRSLGFTVLRFENKLIFQNIEGVLEDIKKHFKK